MTPNTQPKRADWIAVSPEPIDPSQLLDYVASIYCGAVTLFLGTVRAHSAGKTGITHLEYEAYEDVVQSKIDEIIAEARTQWKIEQVAVVHRTGSVQLGETSVAVAVGSGHRNEAFAAGRYIIDELKARVPIWKKEHWPGGAEWVREDLEQQQHE
jgi:molybdopterin synthase catalytic subunit